MTDSLLDLDARALAAALRHGPSTVADHLVAVLDRIAALDPQHLAFSQLNPGASRDAEALDRRPPAEREELPLFGVPVAIKEELDVAGLVTTLGTSANTGPAAVDSEVVARLRAAGAVVVGKTHMPEFGQAPFTDGAWGATRNPVAPGRSSGGSSGGSAVAVATRMVPVAIGGDAGGSVRIPSAWCGIVGLKPTRGRVPGESGIASLAGLAVGGPLGRSVGDVALLLDGMVSGPNRYALRAPNDLGLQASGSYVDSLEVPHRPLRIGWNTWSPWSTNYEIAVDRQVNQVFEDTLSAAAELGHEVEHVDPSPAPTYFESFRAVWMASAASLPFPDAALDALEPLTAWLVRTGRSRPAADLPRALAALKQFESQIIADYLPYDLILTPLLAMTPRPTGWFDAADGERNFMQQCQFTPFTSYVNVAGLPALSMPVGMSEGVSGSESPLPIGVQAIGRSGQESTLLRFALDMERYFGWDTRVPPAVSGM